MIDTKIKTIYHENWYIRQSFLGALSHLILIHRLCEGHILKDHEVYYELMSDSTMLYLIINPKLHLIFSEKNRFIQRKMALVALAIWKCLESCGGY